MLPPWIASLGTPVWITEPDGSIGYVNERAEALLGFSADDCIGRRCHEVIAGTDAAGRPCCKPNCPVYRQARKQREIEPASMRIVGADGKSHWLDVLFITLAQPNSTAVRVVHCALEADRAHRIETYLARVASRTPHPKTGRRLGLTPRETEILELLVQDISLHAIAEKTHVSYVTVRNHVQHILAKLEVHSIMEAVACYLLVRD